MNLPTQVLKLHHACINVAPIIGVNIDEQSKITIEFEEIATASERQAAQAIADDWDVNRPEPDWNAFLEGLAAIDGVYAAISAAPMASVIIARIQRLASKASEWKERVDPLLSAWNAATPVLDETQRSALMHLASKTFIPISINSDNQISAT